MKKFLIVIISIGLIGILSLGCDEDKNNDFPLRQNATGLVLYSGDPAVDGCGWLIKIDTILYSPITFDSKFKIDSLKVILDYETTNAAFKCGWRQPGFTQIEIKSIINQ